MNAKTQRREENTTRSKLLFVLLAIFASSPLCVHSSFAEERTPQYPPKTNHTLYTGDQLQLLHENINKYPEAKKAADKIIQAADHWLAYSNSELIANIPNPNVPRDFDVSSDGCPTCGTKIFAGGRRYPWIIDPRRPLTVQCPICKEIFPNQNHPDDGWGWQSPQGKVYNFVAYANHWMMYRELSFAAQNLACAYAITGERKYADKAAVLLKRFAEVYPDMDYEKQSSFAKQESIAGERYLGKIVNHIWETGLICNLASAYDLVFDTMSQRDRSFIEANLLEEAIDAYYSHKIQGNFGMHQKALVYLALTRQFGPKDKWFDGLLNESSADLSMLGLRYALYNLIFRDGLPMETSPEYNDIWVEKIAAMGELLKRTGRDVFQIPKMRRLFDGPLSLIQIRKFTPDLGDSGTFKGMAALPMRSAYPVAYKEYQDEKFNIAKSSLVIFEDLCRPITNQPAPLKQFPPQKPRLLDGYGMAILNNPADTISISLYYGLKGWHGHFDRLGFELFANNTSLMPDLGYPDAMNDFVPGIYTWSKNTISHNTVIIDAHRQLENVPGTVHLFADSPFARVVQIDGNGTYPQCSQYQRTMVMIDIDKDHSYFVDFFDVAGAKQADYSLHGPPGGFHIVRGDFSAPAPPPGTLAGPNVPRGALYDDPELAKNGSKAGYFGYTGSGFQHLFNVQTSDDQHVAALWDKGLTIHLFPGHLQTVKIADAQVSPVNHPDIIKYLLVHSPAEKSRFISVIDPSTVGIAPQRDNDNTIRIQRGDNWQNFDLVVLGPSNQPFYTSPDSVRHQLITDSTITVLSYEKKTLKRLFFAGGSFAIIDNQRFTERELLGKITSIAPQHSTITITTASRCPDLTGRIIHIRNKFHSSAHPVISDERDANQMTLKLGDDLLVGRFRLDDVKSKEAITSTAMPFAPCYRGTALATSDFKFTAQVEHADHGHIYFANPLPADHPLKKNDDVWLIDASVGDDVWAPAIFSSATSNP